MTAGRTVVVGAAILRGGRLLAARRTAPPAYAGLWELPGGKVEAGETPEQAAVREVREELGCTIEADRLLPGSVRIDESRELQVVLAHLVDGTPTPTEHDAVRWLGPDELADVPWPRADLPFLPQLAAELRAMAPVSRAVFVDRAAARAVGTRLVQDGYAAEIVPEGDAWAVLTEAPGFLFELLVEAHDGWLDEG